MYHPAAALHQASLRETLFRDVRALPAALLAAREQLDAERPRPIAVEPVAPHEGTAGIGTPSPGTTAEEQMTLFEERA
jgi:hypothetical protein